MKLVDANVLLYAVNVDADRHEASRRWLDTALSGGDTVGFAWAALLAFLRIATKRGIFPSPLTSDAALEIVEAWLTAAPAVVLEPGRRHPQLLRTLLDDIGGGGNLVTDVHLAALAMEHRCTIVSFNQDFDRFPGVERIAPTG